MEETPVVAVGRSAVTAIASPDPSRAEEKEPAPVLPKTTERARSKTVELRIRLGPDEDGVLKLISATALHENEPSALPLRKLALTALGEEDAPAPIATTTVRARRFWISPLLLLAALIVGFMVRAQWGRLWPAEPQPSVSKKSLADRIIIGESQGNSKARNLHSSATGLAQFVEGTWLDLVKRHRPEIAASLSHKQILRLREDPLLARLMTDRYLEENASLLSRRGLQVTPTSLYLAHFAGPGGAAAILGAPENADAATVIANADRRAGVTREKILSGNPFMRNFTAKDLKEWAELKMQNLNLIAGAAEGKN